MSGHFQDHVHAGAARGVHHFPATIDIHFRPQVAAEPGVVRIVHEAERHAGGKGTAAEKMKALSDAGIHVVSSPADIGVAMKDALGAA